MRCQKLEERAENEESIDVVLGVASARPFFLDQSGHFTSDSVV